MLAAAPPLATLRELNTVYGLTDLYDMLEVLEVRAHNRREADDWHRRQQREK